MPRINVWVEGMKLQKIDAYCKEKGISRSRLFVRGAMSLASSQPIPKCDFCFNPSIGTYEIIVNDWEQGESKVQKKLCAIHLKKSQSESETKEI